jgi:Ca2+-transporting ATPase
MVNAYNARSENQSVFTLGLLKNLWLIGAISISILTLLVFVEVPFIQTLLHTTSLTVNEWILIIVASFGILIVEESRKFLLKTKNVN